MPRSAAASWAGWRTLTLVHNPLAHGRRVRVLATALRFEVQRHGAPRETLVTLPGGGMLYCPSWSGSSRGPICVGLEDVEEQTFLLDTITAGDVALDVGAHLGTYTILMAARGAEVHAFEPAAQVRAVSCGVLPSTTLRKRSSFTRQRSAITSVPVR